MTNKPAAPHSSEHSPKDSPKEAPTLEYFLKDQDEATKEKYASERQHASLAWRKPLDLRYADSLVFFGLLERLVKTLTRRGRPVGTRIWFRRTA